MNRIKTTQRNTLSHTTSQDLMTIYVDGPTFDDFDATERMNMWLTQGSGTTHLEGHRPANVTGGTKSSAAAMEITEPVDE